MTSLPKLPWTCDPNTGCLSDADGTPILFVCLDSSAKGQQPSDVLGVMALVEQAPKLLAAAARVGLLYSLHASQLAAIGVPPALALAIGELTGHALIAGADYVDVAPSPSQILGGAP